MDRFSITEDDLNTVGLIYEAASAPERWREVLTRLADQLDAGAGVLAVSDHRYNEANVAFTSDRYTKEDIREYQEWGYKYDRLDAVLSAPAGEILTDEDTFPNRDEFWSSPHIQWRLKKYDLPRAWGANLNDGEGWRDAVLFQCSEKVWPPELGATSRFRMFHPHIARAARIGRLRSIIEARYQRFMSALDMLNVGVVLLYSDSGIAFANAESRRIAEARGAMQLRSDGIRVFDETCRAEFASAISRAIAASRFQSASSDNTAYRLGCADGLAPCLAEVLPIRDSDLVGGALVFVIDPENESTFSVAGLGALYSLSDSEVSVCDLVLKGLSNRQIAEDRGVSSETVKSQVSNIFLKTRRQSRLELMRLVVKINPPLKSE